MGPSEKRGSLMLDSAAHPLDLKSGEFVRVDSPILAACKILWRDRLRLRAYLVVGVIVGTLVSLLIPNSYKATARLMPPETSNGSALTFLAAMSSKAGIPASAATDLLGMKSTGQTFVAILQSRTVQDHLINEFDLRRAYWIKTYQDTRLKLASRTDVSEDKKSGVITIEVTDRDRVRAAKLAQGYVEELNRLVAQLTTSSAHRERVFLEERLAVVKKDLDEASRQLGEFSSKNTAIDIKEQGRAMVEAAATLQGELIASESQLQGLEQIYSSQNVRVRSLKARISELERQLQGLGGKESEGDGMTAQQRLYPSIRQLPLLGERYADLYRHVKIEETVFETLTGQYELARVEEAKEIPTVKVLDNPEPPEKKSFPPRTLLFSVIVLLTCAIGCAAILARELWWEIDRQEPHKEFLQRVWAEIHPSIARGLFILHVKPNGTRETDKYHPADES